MMFTEMPLLLIACNCEADTSLTFGYAPSELGWLLFFLEWCGMIFVSGAIDKISISLALHLWFEL